MRSPWKYFQLPWHLPARTLPRIQHFGFQVVRQHTPRRPLKEGWGSGFAAFFPAICLPRPFHYSSWLPKLPTGPSSIPRQIMSLFSLPVKSGGTFCPALSFHPPGLWELSRGRSSSRDELGSGWKPGGSAEFSVKLHGQYLPPSNPTGSRAHVAPINLTRINDMHVKFRVDDCEPPSYPGDREKSNAVARDSCRC